MWGRFYLCGFIYNIKMKTVKANFVVAKKLLWTLLPWKHLKSEAVYKDHCFIDQIKFWDWFSFKAPLWANTLCSFPKFVFTACKYYMQVAVFVLRVKVVVQIGLIRNDNGICVFVVNFVNIILYCQLFTSILAFSLSTLKKYSVAVAIFVKLLSILFS